MRCLLSDQWTDSWLDSYRGAGDYRIRVRGFANLQRLTGIYFVREHSARLLWNYLWEVGFLEVWRKVESRLQERFRNEKFVSFGVGEVLDAPPDARHEPGAAVIFLAPGFPACVERVVLPELFLAAAPPAALSGTPEGSVQHLVADELAPSGAWWDRIRGWSRFSGFEPGAEDRARIATFLDDAVRRVDWSRAQPLPATPPSEVRETSRGERRAPRDARKKRGVLFGYGHYAKTNILPNVARAIEVDSIHEVDPAQIGRDRRDFSWDTAPHPRSARDYDDYDVFLIAGYHHSHAPLAVEALERGAYAVVEKPLAVDRDQLESLLDAVKESSGGYFGCFHKRYSPLNDYAIIDLRQPPEAPVDYHCVVYEVPLPDLHWYRWPHSKSRLVSNGCHWIDHFLYLNGFKDVESIALDRSPRGTVQCSATLVNGAYFTMTLTDKGSERIGLQEHVELRSENRTITIRNNSSYLAEDDRRVLRRLRVNKNQGYKLMYREIASRIARGEEGDTYRSIQVSTGLMLALEAELASRGGGF